MRARAKTMAVKMEKHWNSETFRNYDSVDMVDETEEGVSVCSKLVSEISIH